MTRNKRLALGLLMLACTASGMAGTVTGQFAVNIQLSGAGSGTGAGSAPGVCISQTLSEQTNALVRVVCATGQFVSITALPGRQFLGTHGGAFRYVLNTSRVSGGMTGPDDFYPGTGTATTLRIYNVNGDDGPLEMLVRF